MPSPPALLAGSWCKLGEREASGRRGPSTGKPWTRTSGERWQERQAARGPLARSSRGCSILWRGRAALPPRRFSANGPRSSAPSLPQFTTPDRVVWPRRQQDGDEAPPAKGWRVEGAILVLRVEGPRAIEVQHRSGKILERVNTYFGYRAITEMRIVQAPVVRAEPSSPRPPEAKDAGDPARFRPRSSTKGCGGALSRLGASARSKLTRG